VFQQPLAGTGVGRHRAMSVGNDHTVTDCTL
jgi:hypothetical protein